MVSKVKQLLAKALTINMHAIRAGIHTTLGSFSKITNRRDNSHCTTDWTVLVTMKRKYIVSISNMNMLKFKNYYNEARTPHE